MSKILIADLNPNDACLYTLTDIESLSIMGGGNKKNRPPVHERWWFKALVKVATTVVSAIIVDKVTE